MSRPPANQGEPITGRRQLVEYFEAGCKPPEAWRAGTEHEKFAFDLKDHRPLPYEAANGGPSIRRLLEGMTRFGWEAVEENGKPIALSRDDCAITLEPGGQFELSGAPLATVHQTCSEVHTHLDEVREVCQEIGAGMLGLGFNPKWRRDDIPWMPKGRYKIMRAYMPKKGSLGLDMMTRTCTVQTNLDFGSEADMVRKMRVSLALQPVATALYANSPFTEGRPNGFLSYRSHIWTDTDPDRCGMLPFVFEDGFGFERYVDYLLDVPMYFVYRDGRYIDASGQSFRDFLVGKLPALPGETPKMGDFSDHVTTVFPEVRLKRYIEVRGADGGPWRSLCALPALWMGLLYDDAAIDAAEQLVSGWTAEDHEYLRAEVPRRALKTRLGNRTVREIALEMLDIARAGLERRSERDWVGRTEAGFLDALQEVAESGQTPAERLLEQYETAWHGDIDRIFVECAY